MSEAPRLETYDVVCPHCRKPFTAELLGGGARHRGFKCPHCKLFVPYERADERRLVERADGRVLVDRLDA